jgi:hypothetical protein
LPGRGIIALGVPVRRYLGRFNPMAVAGPTISAPNWNEDAHESNSTAAHPAAKVVPTGW